MADNNENEKNDKSPLLKPKKPRPPPSEKQMENFKKMAEKRAENIAKKKEEKIIQAKRDLLEKEGYVKKDIKKETLAKKEETIQFKIDDDDEDGKLTVSEDEFVNTPPRRQGKKQQALKIDIPPLIKEDKKNSVKEPKAPRAKKIVEPEISSSEDDDGDSSSSEEIVIIKREQKK